MLRLYRVVAEKDADTAFSREGASGGGRWTTAGTPVVYASSCCSCAMLEFLAHLDGEPEQTLFLVEAAIPRERARHAPSLPPDWHERPYRAHVQAIGDAWVRSHESLALLVPSAISPTEHNVLVNVAHPDAASLAEVRRSPLHLDSRLWRREGEG